MHVCACVRRTRELGSDAADRLSASKAASMYIVRQNFNLNLNLQNPLTLPTSRMATASLQKLFLFFLFLSLFQNVLALVRRRVPQQKSTTPTRKRLCGVAVEEVSNLADGNPSGDAPRGLRQGEWPGSGSPPHPGVSQVQYQIATSLPIARRRKGAVPRCRPVPVWQIVNVPRKGPLRHNNKHTQVHTYMPKWVPVIEGDGRITTTYTSF